MLDGIRARRDTAFYPPAPAPKKQLTLPSISLPKTQLPRLKAPRVRIPIAIWVVGFIVTAGAFLIQPAKQLLTAEASTIPTSSTVRSANLPLDFARSINQSTNSDQVIVIDQPTTNSVAQPDTISPVIVADSTTHVLPTVRVLNGGAATGKAADTRTSLEAKHYHVLSVGSAQFTYVQTTIYYLAGNKDNAKAVAAAIGQSDATLTEDSIAGPADVLVVLGTNAL